MKNKLLSILLTICMVALLLPVSVIPAYAETTTETRTVTWYMNSGHGTTCNKSDHQAEFSSDGQTMLFTWTDTEMLFHYGPDGEQFMFMDVLSNNLSVTFPYLEGTVTAVELKNLSFFDAGMKFSVGNGSQNLTNGNSAYCTSVDGGDPQDVTFTGSVNVDADHPLRFTFSVNGTAPEYSRFFGFWDNGSYIKVTYTPAAATDHGHSFNITTSGNVLTATCTNDEQSHQCITNHQATLTLVANDGPAHPFFKVSASLDPTLGEFNNTTQLGATCTVEYAPQGTSNWTTTAPNTEGNYTARATVSIGGTDYVLTSNFRVLAGYYITNNNPQQLSINKIDGAMAGEDVIVTFTPKMGESVTTLTVTGDTTSLSIGSGITDNGDNTYTFAMPNENVTIGATFNFPANSNFTQDGNTYIIKNADGWDYFCQRMRYDANLDGFIGKTVELAADINVTTMAGAVHPFKGTFDGDGHALDFRPATATMYCAPFQNTDGATICNLHVTGLIEGGTNSYLGGLVGSAEGNLTIRDCHVSTQISSTVSGSARIGGFVGLLSSQYNQCHITGCVFDGLIYNPEYSGTTYGCGGFVGCFSQYGYAILEDCLFIEGQYDNNNGKCELWWGNENDKNSTFLYRINNQGEGKLTNCFYVGTHGLKQGSPAVESTDAPTNFAHLGDPTDHRFMQTYGHTMVFNGKYYTPIYGDLVEYYNYSGVKGYNIEYDDAPLGIPDITSPLWTDVLRYNRAFTKDKPVIVMLPFNFTKDNITLAHSSQNPSGHFYSFAGVTGSAPVMESANEVTSMTANTPYLYVPGEDTEYLVFYLYDGFYIFTAGNNGGDKTAVSGDWTLTGTYTGKTWTEAEQDFGRTFILNNSGELTDVTDTTIVKPTDGYFVGSVITYTVTFDANGGTGTIAAETVTGGATYTLPACTFTAPEGKIFKEWSVKIGDAEAVNKQPGDTITVTADTTVTALWKAAKPSFAAHSLVLSGQIGVNFFMDLPAIAGVDYADSYMTFTISGAGSVSSDPVPFDPEQTNAKATYYGFTCYVNAIQMADTITATFHYGDGQTISETYSIAQYITTFDTYIEEHPGAYDDETVDLVHALADYGHYVQPFLSATRGWTLGPGEDQYAPMDAVYMTEYDIDAVGAAVNNYAIDVENGSTDITGVRFALEMESETAIHLYFKPAAGYDGDFAVDGYTAEKQNDGRYLVIIPNICAHQLGETFTITARTANGESTVTVSALSYVKGMLDAPAYQNNAAALNAVASIYHYYAAAAAYKALHP